MRTQGKFDGYRRYIVLIGLQEKKKIKKIECF